jgi:hypothetical protein
MSKAYDPDAMLLRWFSEQLAQHPDLTVERLVRAAATHFNRPNWPRQNPATHRAWRLAQEVSDLQRQEFANDPNHFDHHAAS